MPATSFKRATAPSVRIFLGAGATRTLTVNFTPLLFALGRLYSLLPDPPKMEFVKQMEGV